MSFEQTVAPESTDQFELLDQALRQALESLDADSLTQENMDQLRQTARQQLSELTASDSVFNQSSLVLEKMRSAIDKLKSQKQTLLERIQELSSKGTQNNEKLKNLKSRYQTLRYLDLRFFSFSLF